MYEQPPAPTIIHATPINIDMAISNFHIEFDRKRQFTPGDEISGNVVMDVWSPVEVQHVEFVIQGRGTIRVFKVQ